MIGKTLGHYEITGLLGKGGMGEVYRARDKTLGRDVALKVLPTEFSRDTERVARFAREATTLAMLQHTNVATIYGFEQDAEQPFLVMELVEGEDLAERLQRGPMPVEEAMLAATQIAEGLEAAHALGVVHRDLKPANIKITPSGDVKLLDFGLARAFAGETASSSGELSNSPTITAAMTQAGVILGTAAYMSPEQARGKSIDRQADVWSFGVVLYEMLTTERLFGGETVSDSIGAILHRDPDLSLLPPVPDQIRTLLRRCLARDKRKRLRDIGDARLELGDAMAAGPRAGKSTGRSRVRVPWVAASAMAVLALVLGWLMLTGSPESGIKLTTLGLPRVEAVDLGVHNAWPRLSFSPDGRRVAYIGGDSDEIFMRDVDSFDSVVVPGTERAALFAFSPDGLWLTFTARSKLWKVAVSGGAPIELCDTRGGPGLAWGNGEIYFVRTNGGGLWSVPEDGGEPRAISTVNDAAEETSHRWPSVLPDGRHLLITVKTARIETFDDALIGLLSLETGEVETLVTGGMHPKYVPTGHIVYGRDSQLFAVGFDLDALTVSGTPRQVLPDVDTVDVNGCAQYALSDGGNLAYLTAGEDKASMELVWKHVSGRTVRAEINHDYSFQFSFAPDGTQFASLVPAANDKIYVYDFARETITRLTSTPGNDTNPVWSPDGGLIAYQNDRDGSYDIYVIPADGSAPARRVFDSDMDEFVNSWTPDSKELVFTKIKDGGTVELGIVGVDGKEEPSTLFASENNVGSGVVSPDGRWIAYVSDASGDRNVYARPFERSGNPVRISVAGGIHPQWSPDGEAIYYRTQDMMMAASVESGGTLAVGRPREIFELDENGGTGVDMDYCLHPDGNRFLVNDVNPQLRRHFGIRVVFDWTNQLVP